MASWPQNPIIYEINTWVWLKDLSQRYQRTLTLATVPPEEWDALASWGFDAVWLMGVWERSPAGTRIAREQAGWQAEYRQVLADLTPGDLTGSPYCIHRYRVDERLGGAEGLAAAREQLTRRGLRLLLDFVPNHVALDHPWVWAHPEYFIQGDRDDLTRSPEEFFEAGGKVLAHGRDPYFPPWPDVAQINAFNPGLRRTYRDTLGAIAQQCDGVRCDMAMLLINRIFQQTWGARAGASPAQEYWQEIILAVHGEHPPFLFLAEAYWDLERDLLEVGFDYCYDKRLYDRLAHDRAESVRLHLLADPSFQQKLVRFIENHDEPRAAATFAPPRARAAALTGATLPGAKLFHEGQFEGRKIRLPVQLGRRPPEAVDFELQDFYRKLLKAVAEPVFREGEWRLCECRGWPDNLEYLNLVAWCWRRGEDRRLIVVNLSGSRSRGLVFWPWKDLAGQSWSLSEVLNGEFYAREGNDLLASGLFIDLTAWNFHFFRFAVS
jgi:hypothetical protein